MDPVNKDPETTPPNNTTSTAATSDNKIRKPLPLPPQWTKVMSNKGPYYWNKETNVTQWKFPREDALAFVHLQKTHGYINLPSSNTDNSPSLSPKLPPKSNRARLSQRKGKPDTAGKPGTAGKPDIPGKPGIPGKTGTAGTSGGAGTTGTANTKDETGTTDVRKNGSPSPGSRPKKQPVSEERVVSEPSVIKGQLDNEQTTVIYDEPPSTPPPSLMSCDISMMSCDTKEDNSNDESDADLPPPVPARNYTEEDLKELNRDNLKDGINKFQPSPGDSPPPPIPTRTELSNQLVTPPDSTTTAPHFIYSSNISDISVVGNTRKPSLLTRPPLPDPSSQTTTSNQPLLYDEITEHGLRGVGAAGTVSTATPGNRTSGGHSPGSNRPVVHDNTTKVQAIYDEVLEPSTRSQPRVPRQSSLDDRLLDNRPPLPDPSLSTTANNGGSNPPLIYDEVLDPNLRSASRVPVSGNRSTSNSRTPQVHVEPGVVRGEYNTLDFNPGSHTSVPPPTNSSTDTNKPPLVYDEVFEPGLRNSAVEQQTATTNNTDTVVYDEVPSELIHHSDRPQGNHQPSNNTSNNVPPAYNELDYSVTSNRHSNHQPSNNTNINTAAAYNELDYSVTSNRHSNHQPSNNTSSNTAAAYNELDHSALRSNRHSDRPHQSSNNASNEVPPAYNELDLSATMLHSNRHSDVHVGGTTRVAQSLPRNARLTTSTIIDSPSGPLRRGLTNNPPPKESPPPPPSSSNNGSPPSPGDRPPLALPPSRTPPRDRRLLHSQSLNPTSQTPPTLRPPTVDHSSRDISPLPPIAAYEVVPINLPSPKPSTTTTTTNVPPLQSKNDDIFMTVNHEAQLQRFQRFGGSLHRNQPSQVNSRRTASTSYSSRNKMLHNSNPSLIDNDKGEVPYDHLNRGLNVTLPRNSNTPVDSTYSKLKVESEKAQMRAGVKVHGSLMSNSSSDVTIENNLSSQDSSESGIIELIHAPDAPSPELKRKPHLYEEFKDDILLPSSQPITRRHSISTVLDDTPIPMIHAPDIHSDKVQRKPHLYEDCDKELNTNTNTSSSDSTHQPPSNVGKDTVPDAHSQHKPHLYEDLDKKADTKLEDTPPLAWDDDLMSDLRAASFDTSKEIVQKPSTVSDSDYNRRLERLENHEYGEIDIPIWPDQQPVLVRQPASDIKKVVRDSWLPPRVNGGDDDLPEGWQKEINEQGQEFYWHIPTGKIQYIKPTSGSHLRNSKSQSPGDSDAASSSSKNTFAAEYLGSLGVTEDTLVKGKSVQVVLSCIKKLLVKDAKYQLYGGLRRGASVHIQVTDTDLRWLSTDNTNSVLVSQPIGKIRVWGVGQENDREFGYIARNMATKVHVCHVFICDIAAIGIAQAMLNSHNKTSTSSRRSSMDIDLSAGDIGNNESSGGTVLVQVPLAAVHRERSVTNNNMETVGGTNPAQDSTTSDGDTQTAATGTTAESYKRLEAIYIGFTDVTGPHGIDVLNQAVSQLSIAKSRWLPVYVDIATSHIKILDKKSEQVLKEHRVRFLSFLGIATDDRYCGYVVDNGDNQFLFHGFQCHPNADRLCLALHSACQARYQRVIDAHLNEGEIGNMDSSTVRPKRSLLSRIGSWKSKPKQTEEDLSKASCQSFIVQFLGCELVPKPNGVDSIKEPLKKVTQSTSSAHLVELVVTGTGFTVNDPQKKYFATKSFLSKKICYCAKVRSYFVFIAREGSKHYCYMFGESDTELSRLTVAINQLVK